MKSKTACVIKVLLLIAFVAAVIAAVLLYKNEILDAIDCVSEKFATWKRRRICGKEFEDYEDDIL